MLSNVLKRIGLGFLMGMAIGNIISLMFSYASTGEARILSEAFVQKMGSEPLAFLIQVLLCGVIGMAGVGGMSFYDIEHWSMLKTAVVHYLLCIAVLIPCALFLVWFETAADILVMAVIEAVAYFLIWLVFYIKYRVQVGKLNLAFQTQQGSNCAGDGVHH